MVTRLKVGSVAVYPTSVSHTGEAAGNFNPGTTDAQGNPLYQGFFTVNGVATAMPLAAGSGAKVHAAARGINNSGVVVGEEQGYEGGPWNAVVYRNGATTNLNSTLGSSTSMAVAVNNAGQILCYATFSDLTFGSVILNPDNSQVLIPNTFPYAINSAGHVVGTVEDGGLYKPFFFAAAADGQQAADSEIIRLSTATSLGWTAVLNSPNFGAFSLNDSDQIVGTVVDTNSQQHAVYWPNGGATQAPTDLGHINHGNNAAATWINSAGHIVGMSDGRPFYLKSVGAPIVDLNIQVSEGITGNTSYQIYYVSSISDTEKVLGGAAPNQVPPVVGVAIQLPVSGGSGSDLRVTAASFSPAFLAPDTAPSQITLSVTFSRPLKASEATVKPVASITGPGLPAPLTFAFKINRVATAGKTLYSITADKLPGFAALSQAPLGTYSGTVTLGSGTPAPFSFALVARPAPATLLTATPGSGSVVLNWTASTSVPVDGYNIYRTPPGSRTSPVLLNHSPLTAVTYTDSPVSNGTSYTYTVKAVKASVLSAASNSATATPNAPALLSVTATPTSVTAGDLVHVTAAFDRPLPSAGVAAKVGGLSSGDSITLRPDVSDATKSTFDVHTSNVANTLTVKISVTYKATANSTAVTRFSQPVTVTVVPLQLLVTAVSITPGSISKAHTAASAISFSVTFNRAIKATESPVELTVAITPPSFPAITFPVSVKRDANHPAKTVYVITGDKIKNFGAALASPTAPTGDYTGTLSYNGGTALPFSFHLSN